MSGPVLGKCHPDDIAEYLELIGDPEAAERFRRGGQRSQGIGNPFRADEWGYTGAKIGFIPEGTGALETEIENAIGMKADDSLQDQALKITLDCFYCHNYPGLGKHTVLCDFSGKNQCPDEREPMRFTVSVSANDRAPAAHVGLPIFVGVNVGRDGLSFEGRTVNVCSSADDLVLEALGASAFRDGLSLLTTAQPVLKPFVKLAEGAVGSILKRRKNREVFKFSLGLDFSKSATSAKLRLGSYVVVQTDEHDWDWSDFVWDASGSIRPKESGEGRIGLNYLVFGVTRASEPA